MKKKIFFLLYFLTIGCDTHTDSIDVMIDGRTQIGEYESLVLCTLAYKGDYPLLQYICIYGSEYTKDLPYEVFICLQDQLSGEQSIAECIEEQLIEYLDLSPAQIQCISDNESLQERAQCISTQIYKCIETCAKLEEKHRTEDCQERPDICIEEAVDIFLYCEERYCTPLRMVGID